MRKKKKKDRIANITGVLAKKGKTVGKTGTGKERLCFLVD